MWIFKQQTLIPPKTTITIYTSSFIVGRRLLRRPPGSKNNANSFLINTCDIPNVLVCSLDFDITTQTNMLKSVFDYACHWREACEFLVEMDWWRKCSVTSATNSFPPRRHIPPTSTSMMSVIKDIWSVSVILIKWGHSALRMSCVFMPSALALFLEPGGRHGGDQH
jgi:hypothetical protein